MDMFEFPVLNDQANSKRIAGIERRRKERQEIEWANRVVEWAWFAGAGLFCLGAVFGMIFVRVSQLV